MKLNIVPARTGLLWVKLGMKTFLKQPLALTGLFFMYMAAVLVLSQIPLVGPVIGAMLVPAATLGLMAATAEVERGRFPMPAVLVSAFRAGRQRARAMLVLGMAYFVMFLAVSWLLPMEPGPAAGQPPQLRASPALLLVAVLQLPMLIVFSLAPALVHWHEVSAVKSLFFSIVAFGRNLGAYVVFAAAWCLLVAGLMLLVGVVFAVLGATPALATLSPILFVVAAMISASLYFTFRDSFQADDAQPAAQPTAPEEERTP